MIALLIPLTEPSLDPSVAVKTLLLSTAFGGTRHVRT